MTKHKIKSWAHFFDAIKAGKKLHDLRKMDREYNVGDVLVLQRYDNINGEYTGEEIEVEVTYITSNKTPCAFSSSALHRDYAILSLKLLNLVEIPDCENPDNKPLITIDNFMQDRPLPIVKKGIDFGRGGIVRPDINYIVGEKPSEQTRLNPVTPNPNAEYYQNG